MQQILNASRFRKADNEAQRRLSKLTIVEMANSVLRMSELACDIFDGYPISCDFKRSKGGLLILCGVVVCDRSEAVNASPAPASYGHLDCLCGAELPRCNMQCCRSHIAA